MRKLCAIVGVCFLFIASNAQAQINVFVDFGGFETELDSATGSAGVADFTAGEIATIQTNILDSLNTLYSGFDITFTTTNPGGTFETLDFGVTGSGFGLADRIDFGNQVGNDVGRIFTGNFGTFIEAGDSRATQILEISTSLAGTAGHELGHNIGLEHRDPYGMAAFPASNSTGGFNTGGAHNMNVMGTGITGLSEVEREVPRVLSDISRVKVNFAQGAVPGGALAIENETGSNNNTAANAQNVDLLNLVVGGGGYEQAAAFIGSISSGTDIDYYSVDMIAGEKMTIQAISSVISGINTVDTILTAYDLDGTSILVQNDDTSIDGNSVNPGSSGYSTDASIYNFEAVATGRYFFSVESFGSGTGTYNLLFASTQTIPEPSTGLVIVTALAFASIRRRRRA